MGWGETQTDRDWEIGDGKTEIERKLGTETQKDRQRQGDGVGGDRQLEIDRHAAGRDR